MGRKGVKTRSFLLIKNPGYGVVLYESSVKVLKHNVERTRPYGGVRLRIAWIFRGEFRVETFQVERRGSDSIRTGIYTI